MKRSGFWILRAGDAEDLGSVRRGRNSSWTTDHAPPGWSQGDVVFVCESNRMPQVVAPGALMNIKKLRGGAATYDVEYIQDRLEVPLTFAQLREDVLFEDAGFLDKNAVGELFALSEDQGEALLDAAIKQTPRKRPRRSATQTAAKESQSARKREPAPGKRTNGVSSSAEPTVALSVRQPWAELIVRGIKTIEVRSVPTKKNERVFVYASLGDVQHPDARRAEKRHKLRAAELQRGMIIGAVNIVGCRPLTPEDSERAAIDVSDAEEGLFAWELEHPERLEKPWAPKNHPQPTFFKPK